MTKNWNDLPDEMKEMVVDNMDIFTRFRLKMCSKRDKRLVESIPFYCDKISIEGRYNISIRMQLLSPSWNVLVTSSNATINYNKRKRVIEFSSLEESMDMVKCMLQAVASPNNVRIEYFETNMKLTDFLPDFDRKFDIKHLNFFRTSLAQHKWLDALVKPPQKLVVGGGWNGMGSHEIVKSVTNLVVEDSYNIDDEQFLNFKATNMDLYVSKITENGINAFVKKMIAEDYPIGSFIELFQDPEADCNKFVDGLNYEMTGRLSSYENLQARIDMSPTKFIRMTVRKCAADDFKRVSLGVAKKILKRK